MGFIIGGSFIIVTHSITPPDSEQFLDITKLFYLLSRPLFLGFFVFLLMLLVPVLCKITKPLCRFYFGSSASEEEGEGLTRFAEDDEGLAQTGPGAVVPAGGGELRNVVDGRANLHDSDSVSVTSDQQDYKNFASAISGVGGAEGEAMTRGNSLVLVDAVSVLDTSVGSLGGDTTTSSASTGAPPGRSSPQIGITITPPSEEPPPPATLGRGARAGRRGSTQSSSSTDSATFSQRLRRFSHSFSNASGGSQLNIAGATGNLIDFLVNSPLSPSLQLVRTPCSSIPPSPFPSPRAGRRQDLRRGSLGLPNNLGGGRSSLGGQTFGGRTHFARTAEGSRDPATVVRWNSSGALAGMGGGASNSSGDLELPERGISMSASQPLLRVGSGVGFGGGSTPAEGSPGGSSAESSARTDLSDAEAISPSHPAEIPASPSEQREVSPYSTVSTGILAPRSPVEAEIQLRGILADPSPEEVQQQHLQQQPLSLDHQKSPVSVLFFCFATAAVTSGSVTVSKCLVCLSIML